ncbi:hypothetical protein UNPF46_29375 [Bradyrhizobium sp. UNPF46]|nr:hypothetical protein UNPF46_29375 [Bradyrhizobium sp. UNPF46]
MSKRVWVAPFRKVEVELLSARMLLVEVFQTSENVLSLSFRSLLYYFRIPNSKNSFSRKLV